MINFQDLNKKMSIKFHQFSGCILAISGNNTILSDV